MALDLETTTSLKTDNAPSGWTAPATTNTFTDAQEINFEYTVASSGISHADTQSTGLTALVSAIDTWLTNTFIPTTLGIDVTGNTVTAIGTIKFVTRDNSGYTDNYDPAIFVTGTDQYTVKGTLQWEIS